MIIAEDLSKQYEDFLAVDGIHLTVKPGEVLALLGPNGAGKTTTVRMLSSVLRPSRGRARVAGFDVASESAKVRAAVGVLTEQHGLYMRMAAWEYLDFFGQLYGLDPATRRKRSRRLLEDLDLWEFRERRVGHYSRGMKQKLALARVMLHEPAVLLLDEPTSALDPESAYLVREAIQALRGAERAIVLCTHNLAEAEKLADQIAIIRRGRIISHGPTEALKQRLLGPPEYEVRFARRVRAQEIFLPFGLAIEGWGPDWLRFRPSAAVQANPAVLRSFLDQNLPVVSVQEVPRSLEQVYLEIIGSEGGGEALDVH